MTEAELMSREAFHHSGIDWSAIEGTFYDRGDSLTLLDEAYERCLDGNEDRELVLITGPSGVGKTALASTLKERVSIDSGLFLSGKFDEVASTNHLTTESYGSFKEAFTEYSNLVLGGGKEMVKAVRRALEEAMSSAERLVLLETIPALNKILHSRDSHQVVLKGADAEVRFVYIFVKFVRTISSLGYPVILFLDDIQWASTGSLALLKATAAIEKERTKPQLLILCTCRSDGDTSAALSSQLASGEFKLTHIKVSGMSLPVVHRLVCDVLRLEADTTPRNLAESIFSSTQGNAFHILQLLKVLDEEGLLTDPEGEPKWDMEDVYYFGCSPSVTDIVARRIERLPNNVKDVLKVAACLGCSFSEVCLMEGVLMRSSEIKSAIHQCTGEGILMWGSDNRELRFSHDKFQRATYVMIPESKRDEFHLNIGRRLLHWLAIPDREEHLMLIVDQISRGTNLIKDKEEKRDLAALFLRAGKRAAQASSFSAAVAYLKIGIQLLSSKCWSNQYELSLNLYNAAAEIEYYCGNAARVDELVETILKGAKSFDDTLLARFTKIYCLGSRGEMAQALDEGYKVLKCLGEVFPRKVGCFRIKMELIRCKLLLREKKAHDIINAPVLTDKNKLTAMRLMNIIHTFAFFMGDKGGPMIAARVVQRTLQLGMNELSCAGFANLGLIYATQGDVDEAYRCSRLALGIFEKFHAKEWQARLALAIYGFANPLKHPLRESISHLLEGHRAGIVFGDVCFSALCAFLYCMIRLYAGDPIPDVLDAARTFRKNSFERGQFVTTRFDILIQFCLNFMGKTVDPVILTGEALDEEETLKMSLPNDPVLLKALLVWKHFIVVYMNQFDLATQLANKIEKIKTKMVPFTFNTHIFLQALASASTSNASSDCKHRAITNLNKLRDLAEHCSENYLHKVYLVEAELARGAGYREDAMVKFIKSIELAEDNGFIQEQALACERAGYALLSWGKQDEAKTHFVRARSLFEEWGAQIKVDQLSQYVH